MKKLYTTENLNTIVEALRDARFYMCHRACEALLDENNLSMWDYYHTKEEQYDKLLENIENTFSL